MKNLYSTLFLTLILLTTAHAQDPLPAGRTDLFAGSGSCAICHESDGNVLTHNGEDVSMVTYWRSTMMANASKDPLWRAMVQEEVHLYPQLQETIETTCTKCHSPMGYTEAFYNGQTNYSMAEMKSDPIANDGVSCTACHQVKPDNFGEQSSYSGGFIIEDDSLIYGPYEDPETQSMQLSVGYTPVYTTHMNESELCATCHTLFTPYLDNGGNIAGTFPEQTPYIEWKNSQYPGIDTQCQDCHMPKIYDGIDIATIPPSHQVLRSPFWKHTFVGGNTYILKMLRDNIDSLGVTATAEQFDSTIARAEYNLTEKALELETTTQYLNDSLYVYVDLTNKAGHKLPTGIPLRRMWIHFKVEENGVGTIFESGSYNTVGEINGLNSDYEPHYNLISEEEDVQIYEGVFQDVDNQVTYTLLRAASFAKDNRIPPAGFTSSHVSYDTTKIVGNALTDPNFNNDNGTEGTGRDRVTYRIEVEPNKYYTVTASVVFQAIKPALVEHLRTINEPDVNAFVGLYDALPNTPFVMKTKSVGVVTDVNEVQPGVITDFALYQNYPNPFNPATTINYAVPQTSDVKVTVYSINGSEITSFNEGVKEAGIYSLSLDLREKDLSSGIYFYKIEAASIDGKTSFNKTMKMILLK